MKGLIGRLFSISPTSLTVLVLIFVMILFLLGIPFLEVIELKTYDLRMLSRGVREPSDRVVMAVIDEKSLDKEGRWPWPRTKMTELVKALTEDGAVVIGFDIGFLEPDQHSNLEMIDSTLEKARDLGISSRPLLEYLEKSRRRADYDKNFAGALQASEADTVLGYFFHLSPEDLDYEIEKASIEKRLAGLSKSKYPLVLYKNQQPLISPFRKAYIPETNLPVLRNGADFSGYFNIFPDPDGVVRWMPLIIKCGEEIYPPLSILCAWNYLGRPQLMVQATDYGVEGIRMGDFFIPTDERGDVLINYLGPPKTFPHYSITDIIRGEIPEGTFHDKIVLVGATAVGVYDLRNTPFSPVYPGLEVHATVIDNILEKNFLHKPKWTRIFDLAAIIVLGGILGFVLSKLSALTAFFFAAGLFIFHVVLSRWLFVTHGIWLNIVYPLLALALVYTGITVYYYVSEQREKKKIRGAFSFYVSKSVVNEMLQNPERLKLGGDKKELTVLFSDIRGFTSISEGLGPEELASLLNEYLTIMTDVVFRRDGTLDKYIGDEIMTVYGAPVERPHHAADACHSALDMVEELSKMNKRWMNLGKPLLEIGIGINTGMMMVGNMGSEQRFDYTVMGDAVNIGSRLEGATKTYRTNVLISETTYNQVKEEFLCMEVDKIKFVGKKLPVRIYQLLGRESPSEVLEQAISVFQKGLRLYRNREWDEAIRTFQTVLGLDKGLGCAQTYIERCRALKKNPPPPEWEGTYTMRME